jgi:hypothetical protein
VRRSASDALALLLASVGLGDALACPACPTGPGIGIDLAVDAQCHGVHVEIPAGALPAGGADLDCSIDPRVWALPCVSSLDVGPSLSFDARSVFEASNALRRATLLACRADAAAVRDDEAAAGHALRVRSRVSRTASCTGGDRRMLVRDEREGPAAAENDECRAAAG